MGTQQPTDPCLIPDHLWQSQLKNELIAIICYFTASVPINWNSHHSGLTGGGTSDNQFIRASKDSLSSSGTEFTVGSVDQLLQSLPTAPNLTETPTGKLLITAVVVIHFIVLETLAGAVFTWMCIESPTKMEWIILMQKAILKRQNRWVDTMQGEPLSLPFLLRSGVVNNRPM